jgi:uncharacterized heparinase superfamily protein
MIGFDRLRLLFETARHLSPSQIRSRASAVVRRGFRKATNAQFRPPREVRLAAHSPLWRGLDAVAAIASRHVDEARRIGEGRFKFLNREVVYRDEPNWHDPDVPQLWRFHLHYFNYVRELAIRAAAGEREAAYATFRALVDSWLRRNRYLLGDGWQAYTASVRVVNWCHALQSFAVELKKDPDFHQRLVGSLYGQVRFVAENLETDVRGNHLLKNLRAIIWGGVVFEGQEPNRWLDHALRMLEVEIGEQVLGDGGHFERAPGYHLLVLCDVVETIEFLRRNRAVPLWLDNARERMFDFLDAILPPDGRLPLFKDTTLENDPHPLDLFTGSGIYSTLIFGEPAPLAVRKPARPPELLCASGYAVVRSPRHHLVVDVGKPCPDYLPAHAHADMFSFELTIDGSPVVVDAGVYEYAAGKWRDHFRSTRVHNTVEVAGANQSEVWGSFRVARRAVPKNVTVRNLDGITIVQGEHDGYMRLFPPVMHRRTLASIDDSLWIVIDELFGSGMTRAANYVHIMAEVHIATAGGSPSTQKGWHSPRFGELLESKVVVLAMEGMLPLRSAYALSLDPNVTLRMEKEDVTVVTPERTVSLAIPRNGLPFAR